MLTQPDENYPFVTVEQRRSVETVERNRLVGFDIKTFAMPYCT